MGLVEALGAGVRRSVELVSQMQPKISASLIAGYSASPSANRSAAVKSLHGNIRSALENWGDKKFDTFLQGSYRNGTAIADINDVDIIALYDPWSSPETHARWEWLLPCCRDPAQDSTRVGPGQACGFGVRP